MIKIRKFEEKDWANVWPIIETVFRKGETYPHQMETTEEEARHAWIDIPTATYVALSDKEEVIGTYYVKPNQPGLGSHVCNCGYMVAENAYGKGIGSAMCRHSQREAKKLGFKSMQFNLVVSTNERSLRLWEKHGFETVGVLPRAFNHKQKGYVDALVMYKQLGG
jgi:L-amino acid N-acyltransferase YncA